MASNNNKLEHSYNGKAIKEGSTVPYYNSKGEKFDAVLKHIHPAQLHADIEATVDGSSKFFENVPFSEEARGGHTWSTAMEEEEASEVEQEETDGGRLEPKTGKPSVNPGTHQRPSSQD